MSLSDYVLVQRAKRRHIRQLAESLGQDHHIYFRARFPLQRRGDGEILIAVLDGTAVGAVWVSWREADEPDVRKHLDKVPLLYHFEVQSALRGQGIGTKLLHYAEDLLLRRGFSKVALGVNETNEGARRLYLRNGFSYPEELELRGLADGGEPYDVLVADLGS